MTSNFLDCFPDGIRVSLPGTLFHICAFLKHIVYHQVSFKRSIQKSWLTWATILRPRKIGEVSETFHIIPTALHLKSLNYIDTWKEIKYSFYSFSLHVIAQMKDFQNPIFFEHFALVIRCSGTIQSSWLLWHVGGHICTHFLAIKKK